MKEFGIDIDAELACSFEMWDNPGKFKVLWNKEEDTFSFTGKNNEALFVRHMAKEHPAISEQYKKLADKIAKAENFLEKIRDEVLEFNDEVIERKPGESVPELCKNDANKE